MVLEAEARLQVRRGDRVLNNRDMAASYMRQAEERLHHAEEALRLAGHVRSVVVRLLSEPR